MKMNGVPVVADASIMAATLFDWVSPAEPPITVKSWEAMCSGRPKTAPEPVTTPSAGGAVLGKHAGFEERIVVDKQIDAFTCGELAFGVLFFNFVFAAA